MISISKTDAQQLCEKICSIELTIYRLKREVEELKKIVNQPDQKEQNDLEIIEPKKRKIHQTEWGNFNVDKSGFVQVFIACSNNNPSRRFLPVLKAGIGIWFGHGHPLNLAELIDRSSKLDKIDSEIEACIRAIEEAHINGVKKLCINTDEKYIVDNMTKKTLMKNLNVKYAKRWLVLKYTIKRMEHVKWNYINRDHGIVEYEAAVSLAKQTESLKHRPSKYLHINS